ncbi:DNA polymerase III subunit gamma/tau [Treponema pedis]|uniref:DNA polymerase III subunit gamma/tau n=1 Tax=Treponema pedis TaxID=409322 RepID=UPI00197F672D|nr:DNA polymerase III subunit gamma/tau [Treponema pedis]QSI03883.1 DNA polymerase III subunit gamma/tau [Treponema pedis]
MEYQVTATRRRPQRFEDLLGQEFVAATLQKSIEAGKIAHAYLFSGPRGCGKTSSARILAKVLNCAEGPKSTPCGKCTSCEEITLGSCLDVIEIDGASNTGVNDVRQIKDEILFPPNSNRYKIYIIDEVHMLSTSAFNALLKTIEEPPPYVVFIFATTEIHKVPATIKSRCQQFNFKLVPIEILKEALAGAAAELNIQADDEALYWIAREATGSVRDAYTLFDQVAAFSDGHITFEKIHEKLGLTGIESINKLVSACTAKRGHEALVVLDEILQNGISVEQVVSDCADYFRSLLLVKHGITKEALIGQRAERFPQEILTGWNSVQIEQALSIMLQLFKDLRFSVDPRYELELAVSRLAWLTDYVSPQELKTAYDAAREIYSLQMRLCRNPEAVIFTRKNAHIPATGGKIRTALICKTRTE